MTEEEEEEEEARRKCNDTHMWAPHGRCRPLYGLCSVSLCPSHTPPNCGNAADVISLTGARPHNEQERHYVVIMNWPLKVKVKV